MDFKNSMKNVFAPKFIKSYSKIDIKIDSKLVISCQTG